jgi:multicomponent Na+:H+ antiporter subunit D
LIPPILAVPVFFVAAWYVDQIPLNPQDLALQQVAGGLLGLGLLLLLMPFPLHTGGPAVAGTAAAPATLLVLMLSQLAVLHLAGQLLAAYPLILAETDWGVLLALFGLMTAVWGGLAAIGATTAGQLWGYAALHDWGLIILVLATPGVQSWTLVLFLFGLRAVSMFTAAAGQETIEQHVGRLDFASLRGVGSRLPWNCAAFLLGGLGLLGFPLSAGFAGHWSALQQVALLDWRPAAVVLLASGVAVFGFVRIARTMFDPQANPAPRERAASITVAIIALAVTVAVGLAPQLLNNFVGRALAAFG